MISLKYAHSFEVIHELPENLRPLSKLANNFRWTWHWRTQELLEETDRALWEAVEHNPHRLIDGLSEERLEQLANDEAYLSELNKCAEDLEKYLRASTWFEKEYPGANKRMLIAYFCAEFGLNECLPMYSGGLGVLAGDHLKAASDLGIPLVGIGLLYNRGYFRQFLSREGWQQEYYPQYDFYEMPLQLVRGEDKQPLQIQVDFPDRVVTCQIWKAQVGRVPLYFLDSNVLENVPSDQVITDTLYGGDEEMRISQEIILGIGGMRALEALGIQPTVCHMNEGHAAFVTLEYMRRFMQEYHCDLQTARQVIINGNVFTTHTPVPAGFDVFHRPLLERYLSRTLDQIGMPFEEFLSLGRGESLVNGDVFNMAIFAMENSNNVNAVSKLHAEVSQGLFHGRWPNLPRDEVPIEPITNGVHIMSWMSPRIGELLDRHLSSKWREEPSHPEVWQAIHYIPDSEIWELREDMRGEFTRFCRKHLQRKRVPRATRIPTTVEVSSILDARILTIGFARRFAAYKRANLLFSDKERLKSILYHPERPVQIVFAGKSHPKDDEGKKLIREIMSFIDEGNEKKRIVFLEDYDMALARRMVQGVDLWLNTPRRPYEASGTSGMKAALNGVLNCSILDGWWAEAYDPSLGWAIGEGNEHPDPVYQDWLDSLALYQLLETEITQCFYHRNTEGVPATWVKMIKQSMSKLASQFCTDRMVKEYARKFYMPASDKYYALKEDNLKLAREAVEWKMRMRREWEQVRVLHVEDTASPIHAIGTCFSVKAFVQLGSISPEDVRVQAVSGHVGPNRELFDTCISDLPLTRVEGDAHVFEGTLACDVSGHRGYVVRVIPYHPMVNVMAEIPLVAWEQPRPQGAMKKAS